MKQQFISVITAIMFFSVFGEECKDKVCTTVFKKMRKCPVYSGPQCFPPCDISGCIVKFVKKRHLKLCRIHVCQEKEVAERNRPKFLTTKDSIQAKEVGTTVTKPILTRITKMGFGPFQKNTALPILSSSMSQDTTLLSKKKAPYSKEFITHILRMQQVSSVFPRYWPGVNKGPMPQRYNMSIVKNAIDKGLRYIRFTDEETKTYTIAKKEPKESNISASKAGMTPQKKNNRKVSYFGENMAQPVAQILGRNQAPDQFQRFGFEKTLQANTTKSLVVESKHQGKVMRKVADMGDRYQSLTNENRKTMPANPSQSSAKRVNMERKRQMKKIRKMDQWRSIKLQVERQKTYFSKTRKVSSSLGNGDLIGAKETKNSTMTNLTRTDTTLFWHGHPSTEDNRPALTSHLKLFIIVLIIGYAIVFLVIAAIITVLLLTTKRTNKSYKSAVPSNCDTNIELINLNTF